MVRNIQIALMYVAINLAMTHAADAAIIFDQQQLDDGQLIANFASPPNLVQSFQQFNNNITGARVVLWDGVGSGSGTGDITINLYDNLPYMGGSVLATGIDLGVAPGESAIVDFAGAVSIIPDATYYLVVSSTNSSLGLAGASSNVYDRGQVFGFEPVTEVSASDFAFETFYDTTVAAVPEPSTFALLGLGASCVFARRQRNQGRQLSSSSAKV